MNMTAEKMFETIGWKKSNYTEMMQYINPDPELKACYIYFNPKDKKAYIYCDGGEEFEGGCNHSFR